MKLAERISTLCALGEYMGSDDPAWREALRAGSEQNAWFIPEFMDLAVRNIRRAFLQPEALSAWAASYGLPDEPADVRTVGIVMAGNIPLVGFHDMLCAFVSGHRQRVKCSSQDAVLLPHLVGWMHAHHPGTRDRIATASLLKGCDAYIATGSDNSARYFEQYFAAVPHVIRRNRTSVAVLEGDETSGELALLADDVQTYFGRGCRNVTQLVVPPGYDFKPLLDALHRYAGFKDGHKYRHNYDYNLALHIMNNRFYMTEGSVILVEDGSPFSPIAQLHYRYRDPTENLTGLQQDQRVQCLVGRGFLPFGRAQSPSLGDYADGVDTMAFLCGV